MDNINEDNILRNNIKRSKAPGIAVIFMGLIIIGISIVLIIDANNKDKKYITTSARLYTKDKLYEAGKPYYKIKYEYIANNKKYYYSDPTKYFNNYDEVIVLKYDKNNPKDIYISSYYIYYIIIGGVGVIIFILGIIKLISLTSKNAEKIVIGEIYDALTCVGGKKYYIRTLDSSFKPLPEDKIEYFSYFTNDSKYFKIGKKIKFNAYKYRETLYTETFLNNKTISNINELKLGDFIFYK